MFPTSYHIKVMVRDHAALWLSSGNLNNSNQPDSASPPKTEDRDWHVIIEDQTLATLFEAYLNQDFTSAQPYQISGNPALTEAVYDAAAKLAAETTPLPPPPAPGPTGSVAAKRFANISVKITPLLTPDTLPPGTDGQYVTNMIKLLCERQKDALRPTAVHRIVGGHGRLPPPCFRRSPRGLLRAWTCGSSRASSMASVGPKR